MSAIDTEAGTAVWLVHCGFAGCLPDYTGVFFSAEEAEACAVGIEDEYEEVDIAELTFTEAVTLGWIDSEGNAI